MNCYWRDVNWEQCIKVIYYRNRYFQLALLPNDSLEATNALLQFDVTFLFSFRFIF